MLRSVIISLLATGVRVWAQANNTYDYIVVGSGPGGGPLASNLARAGYSVLLLEAGADEGENEFVTTLPNFNAVANDPTMRWDFFVKHSDDPARELKYEKTVWRTKEGSLYAGLKPPAGSTHLGIWYPRTGTLGGCAMHNAGIAALPDEDDWNIVAEKTGDKSWEAANMAKFWKQIEKNAYLPLGSPGHGFDGWVQVSKGYGAVPEPGTDGHIIDTELGKATGQNVSDLANLVARDLNNADDRNRDQETGFYAMVGHMNEFAQRTGPNRYIRATLADKANYPLTVKTNSFVTKVLFKKDAAVPTAIGVEVLEGPNVYRAAPRHRATAKPKSIQYYAQKEVIVSGGAFNTPQLLKLSGIGPAAELKKFNIPLVKDLPGVGERLADNYEASILQLANRTLGDTAGYVVLMMRTPTAPTPSRNIYAFCGSFSFEGFWPGYPTDHGPAQYECGIVHMAPKSQTGSVTLRSADPQDTPEINFRFFENGGDEDLTEILDAVKTVRKGLRAVGVDTGLVPWNELHPCPGTNQECSDEAQKEYMKLQAYSHHATSSCSIGADNDPLAVLDSKFRVRGVKNLRVVDASAFPVVPGAFPVIPTMILSQKATADLLEAAKAS